jgi:hypothetical protein
MQPSFGSMTAIGISRHFSTNVKEETGVIQQIIPVDPRDLGFVSANAGAPKQRPFAAVLGCSDARVPIELIFNEGPNDLFVIGVAGNGLGRNRSCCSAIQKPITYSTPGRLYQLRSNSPRQETAVCSVA